MSLSSRDDELLINAHARIASRRFFARLRFAKKSPAENTLTPETLRLVATTLPPIGRLVPGELPASTRACS